jgi:hypothetical protein
VRLMGQVTLLRPYEVAEIQRSVIQRSVNSNQ